MHFIRIKKKVVLNFVRIKKIRKYIRIKIKNSCTKNIF